MYSDEVYRRRQEAIIAELELWSAGLRDVAAVEANATPGYWTLSVSPKMPGACAFAILLDAHQRCSLNIAGETYDDKPFDRDGFFAMLARAIVAGHVERIETRSALTGALETIETRVELEDGWAWIGERRVSPRGTRKLEGAQEIRSRRFLPYRR